MFQNFFKYFLLVSIATAPMALAEKSKDRASITVGADARYDGSAAEGPQGMGGGQVSGDFLFKLPYNEGIVNVNADVGVIGNSNGAHPIGSLDLGYARFVDRLNWSGNPFGSLFLGGGLHLDADSPHHVLASANAQADVVFPQFYNKSPIVLMAYLSPLAGMYFDRDSEEAHWAPLTMGANFQMGLEEGVDFFATGQMSVVADLDEKNATDVFVKGTTGVEVNPSALIDEFRKNNFVLRGEVMLEGSKDVGHSNKNSGDFISTGVKVGAGVAF